MLFWMQKSSQSSSNPLQVVQKERRSGDESGFSHTPMQTLLGGPFTLPRAKRFGSVPQRPGAFRAQRS